MVIGVSLRSEKITEHSTKVCNVWLGLEFQRTAVCQVFSELTGATLAQGRDSNTLLLLHNKLVLLGGGLGLESLPWESSLKEVDKDVTDGFEIVSPGLFDSQVIVDGSVTRSSSKGSSFTLRNVLKGTGVSVSLGKAEIDTVNKVSVSASAVSDKVSRLDITMDQVTRVHQFHTFQHLIGNHENCFERESTSAFVELILERRTKQIHNHQVVRVLGSKVVNLGKARGILQFTVHLVFVTELRTPGSMLFELDSDLQSLWKTKHYYL